MSPQEPSAVIEWQYTGKPDALVGTGATTAENALAWIGGLLAAGFYVYLYVSGALDWHWWQYLIAVVIALDVGGGVVANSLNSCKRFYHTPVKPDEPAYVGFAKNPYFFTALHVHPIVAGLVAAGRWDYGLFWYVALIGSTIAVEATPLYLRRPVAMLLILLAIGLNAYVVKSVPGFQWLMPAMFLKIVYGHLVREEPYRPA